MKEVTVPGSFDATYPAIAQALRAMHATEGASKSTSLSQIDIARELALFRQSPTSLEGIVAALLGAGADADRELALLSTSAYRFLGVSDDVRLFMGHLWAAAVSSWSIPQRTAFLQYTVADKHDAFSALDFTAEFLKLVDLSAMELLPWVKRARLQIGNDLMQQGLWQSVQAICDRTPREALTLAAAWLDEHPDQQSLATIANIVGWLRLRATDDALLRESILSLENRLRTSDISTWRAAYIQSHARTLEQRPLPREIVSELFRELVRRDGDEEVAWCFLLHAIVQRDAVTEDEWTWVVQEAQLVARSGMSPSAQYWLVLIALKRLRSSMSESVASQSIELIGRLCPIASSSQATWSQVIGALVRLAKEAPAHLRALTLVLARRSGKEWRACEDRSEFRWLLMELSKQSLDTVVASDLCFAPGMNCRRLGLQIFAGCNVPALASDTVAAVTPTQLELLLLEARRVHVDYAALARLHASVAARIELLGGDFLELLYDEVSRQCRNTHAYRVALRAAASANDYLIAIVDDSEERLKETRSSGGSPALQMDVPGFERAQRLDGRYMASVVAKGVAEKSVFLKFVHKTHLLYGGEQWRHVGADGSLSASATMHMSSAQVEVPQLEIANPEEAQLRRLQASMRIARLEQEAGNGADE